MPFRRLCASTDFTIPLAARLWADGLAGKRQPTQAFASQDRANPCHWAEPASPQPSMRRANNAVSAPPAASNHGPACTILSIAKPERQARWPLLLVRHSGPRDPATLRRSVVGHLSARCLSLTRVSPNTSVGYRRPCSDLVVCRLLPLAQRWRQTALVLV